MMADAEAREVLRRAFALRGMESPTLAELQATQAIGRFEGNYGSGIAGAYGNWGAVQCGTKAPCPPGCVEHVDHDAQGKAYRGCFRVYPSHEAGAADFLRELYRRAGVPDALKAGDATAIAEAMRATGYFEAKASTYALAIEKNAAHVAKALGEPLRVRRGGGLVPVEPPPGDDDGDDLDVALGLIGVALGVFGLARMRRGST